MLFRTKSNDGKLCLFTQEGLMRCITSHTEFDSSRPFNYDDVCDERI